MSEFHFDYSYALNNSLFDDDEEEELFPELNLNISQNNINHNIILNNMKCSFCCEYGHILSRCVKACSIGQKLHLKALEVRQFDLEMCCLGNSIKVWLENLSLMEIFVLSIRVKLEKYANTLWERGMTDMDLSLLNKHQDYITCLRFFYYFEPFGNSFKKKFNFNVGLLEDKVVEITNTNSNTNTCTFECPICIESSLPIKEKIKLNCSHSVCNSCFCNYLNHIDFKSDTSNTSFNKEKKPCCSLCRTVICNAEFVNIDYLNDIKKIYIFASSLSFAL